MVCEVFERPFYGVHARARNGDNRPVEHLEQHAFVCRRTGQRNVDNQALRPQHRQTPSDHVVDPMTSVSAITKLARVADRDSNL
jgi:hypothetical protein